MVSKSTPIAIVGGGAFGLSTALHLVRDGYNNISVFEQDDQIPPRPSAANDLNKIVRAEYEDPFYTDLTMVGSSRAPSTVDPPSNPNSKRSPSGKLPSSPHTSTRRVSYTASRGKPPRGRWTHSNASKPPPTTTLSLENMSCPSRKMKRSDNGSGSMTASFPVGMDTSTLSMGTHIPEMP